MDERTILEDFLTLLTQDVEREGLPAAHVEVRGASDPEEDTNQIFVRLWLNRMSDQDMRDYYRDFGRRVDDWAKQWNTEQRKFFMAKISFQVRQSADS